LIMRYLGIDYGLKRVGIALCDAGETIVSPLCQFSGPDCRPENLFAQLREIICAHEVEALVVGLPLNMDGSEGPQAQQTRKFAHSLAEKLDLKVYLQDERLSSFAADEKLGAGAFTERQRRRRRDMLAACEILQDFIGHKPM